MDISKSFDTLNHKIIMDKVNETLKDPRLGGIIHKFLKAGYILDKKTIKSGEIGIPYADPQGSILGPLITNLYLHEMDQELEIIKENFDTASSRKRNPEYTKAFNRKDASHIKLPKFLPGESRFKSLKFVRYGDDYLIAIIGSKEDCVKIRKEIQVFLKEKLLLNLNIEKTLITHASKDSAFFLGHEIRITPPHKKPTKTYKQLNGK